MTGEHPFIATTGSYVVSPPWQFHFRRLLAFLLKNQFVTDGVSTARVVTGSGMGLEMSGDLCDFIFWYLCERHVLTHEFKASYGIKCWYRFRDNFSLLPMARSLQRIVGL